MCRGSGTRQALVKPFDDPLLPAIGTPQRWHPYWRKALRAPCPRLAKVARRVPVGVNLELHREAPAPDIIRIDSRPLRRWYPDHRKDQLTLGGLLLRAQDPASQHGREVPERVPIFSAIRLQRCDLAECRCNRPSPDDQRRHQGERVAVCGRLRLIGILPGGHSHVVYPNGFWDSYE
jgi:hypothetical protein